MADHGVVCVFDLFICILLCKAEVTALVVTMTKGSDNYLLPAEVS
ncbi:hypothetical protein RV18_GL000265 [Enterococcus termitis]|nr:hypothetical protein RV18_GL000265 [Enterococcus termitis]